MEGLDQADVHLVGVVAQLHCLARWPNLLLPVPAPTAKSLPALKLTRLHSSLLRFLVHQLIAFARQFLGAEQVWEGLLEQGGLLLLAGHLIAHAGFDAGLVSKIGRVHVFIFVNLELLQLQVLRSRASPFLSGVWAVLLFKSVALIALHLGSAKSHSERLMLVWAR